MMLYDLIEQAQKASTDDQLHQFDMDKFHKKLACLIIEELRLNLMEFTLRYDDRASFNIQQYEMMLHHELDEFKKELLDA